MNNKLFKGLASLMALVLCSKVFAAVPVTDINNNLKSLMQAYHVPVVSYAIIEDNKIVAAQALSIDPKITVNSQSIFQAASISKSVNAYAALLLVSVGKLFLDTPINEQLTSWKVPTNNYDRDHPVTLRQILSMTSGLSVSGFPGYRQGALLPTPLQVLNGQAPANTPAITVFYEPGSQYFYSGGGFQVLEQMMTDVTQQPNFESLLQTLVFKRLAMTNSFSHYPLSKAESKRAVPAFDSNNQIVYGGWDNYAIGGAGGMWSTPTDLAKFLIAVSAAYKNKDSKLLPKNLAQQMLTRQNNSSFGLGVVVNGSGSNLNFRKGGHNTGYHSEVIMFPNSGQGLAIMTDSESGTEVINHILPIIAHDMNWPCYFPAIDELATIPEYACIVQN